MEAMNVARAKVLALAADNADTIVPAYTNGVQAQPTTYGHYLLALASALDRDAERLRQAYARLNLSPLGSAALGTSSFPVDRKRLADLLGFDGVVENSYDATQVAPRDEGVEMADITITMALTVGGFVQDIHTQYHQTSPWILLKEGKLTGPSSIMPQKRNPYGLNVLRLKASDVVGLAMTSIVDAHNVTPGMPDYKRDNPEKTLEAAAEMYALMSKLIDGLVINRERALAEVEAEYSTTTELADVLQREADVPFRIGHHFASELVTYGRKNHLKPAEIQFKIAQNIYTEAARKFDIKDAKLPLSEEQFRRSLSARGMINASKGLGGPQPAEVKRMLDVEVKHLAEDRDWLALQHKKLKDANARLQSAFAELMK
jgi:argininosuccinate lyase